MSAWPNNPIMFKCLESEFLKKNLIIWYEKTYVICHFHIYLEVVSSFLLDLPPPPTLYFLNPIYKDKGEDFLDLRKGEQF